MRDFARRLVLRSRMDAELVGRYDEPFSRLEDGKMANNANRTLTTKIPSSFCDHMRPGSGSNENTNGLLRQYLSRGTDLSKVSTADLRALRGGSIDSA
jgi:hypothetical protein